METSNVRVLLPWTRRNSNRKWDRTITEKKLFLIQIEGIHEHKRKLSRSANKIESSGLNFIVHVLFVVNTSPNRAIII